MDSETVLKNAKKRLSALGLTYQQVGERMGYPPESARQSVSQFLNGTNPTVAMLLRFAEAAGGDPGELLADQNGP